MPRLFYNLHEGQGLAITAASTASQGNNTQVNGTQAKAKAQKPAAHMFMNQWFYTRSRANRRCTGQGSGAQVIGIQASSTQMKVARHTGEPSGTQAKIYIYIYIYIIDIYIDMDMDIDIDR